MRLLSKNLYTSTQLSDDAWKVVMADETHPVFKAHFEGNPLLPAFLQIDIFGELLEKKLVSIEKSKFKLPILPKETIIYKIVKIVKNTYKVEISKEHLSTSEFTVSYQ